jgi:hypothetical protein
MHGACVSGACRLLGALRAARAFRRKLAGMYLLRGKDELHYPVELERRCRYLSAAHLGSGCRDGRPRAGGRQGRACASPLCRRAMRLSTIPNPATPTPH